jgi:ribonuclease BN (tRNA processing enzyme)
VRITVLGKSPAWQDAGGACSGYLVESGGTRLLLDCGCGVLGRLRAVCDYAAVDAVVVSHLHADHLLDLVPFASALKYGPRWLQTPAPRPALHAPPGGRDRIAALCAAGGMDGEHVASAFDLAEYDPGAGLEVGALRVRFQPVPHFVPAWAVEVADGSARLTFSADCGPNEGLIAFAAGTDLLLIEATLGGFPDEGDGPRGHLTAAEAGEHGRAAGARRVVLTHISDELDLETARAQASDAFGAAVQVAAELDVYSL